MPTEGREQKLAGIRPAPLCGDFDSEISKRLAAYASSLPSLVRLGLFKANNDAKSKFIHKHIRQSQRVSTAAIASSSKDVGLSESPKRVSARLAVLSTEQGLDDFRRRKRAAQGFGHEVQAGTMVRVDDGGMDGRSRWQGDDLQPESQGDAQLPRCGGRSCLKLDLRRQGEAMRVPRTASPAGVGLTRRRKPKRIMSVLGEENQRKSTNGERRRPEAEGTRYAGRDTLAETSNMLEPRKLPATAVVLKTFTAHPDGPKTICGSSLLQPGASGASGASGLGAGGTSTSIRTDYRAGPRSRANREESPQKHSLGSQGAVVDDSDDGASGLEGNGLMDMDAVSDRQESGIVRRLCDPNMYTGTAATGQLPVTVDLEQGSDVRVMA